MSQRKNIQLLSLFNFLMDFKLYAPVAIIYFSKVSGSFAFGMTVFSIMMISSAIFEIPTGIISDFIGRKRTMILGSLFATFSVVFYALGQPYLFLIVGAIMEGVSRSFYSGNNEAFLYDTLKQYQNLEKFDEYSGKTSSMFQLALSIAALIGGFVSVISLSLVVWLSVIPQAMSLVVSLFFDEPKVQSEKSGNIFIHLKEAFVLFIKNNKLRLLSLHDIIAFGVGEAKFYFQSAFYRTLWPLWAIGLASTFSNFLAFISYWFSGKIIKRFKALNVLIVSNLYGRFINLIATIFPTVVSPALIASISAFFGVSQTAKTVLLQKEFSNEQRATMGSLNSFAGSLFFGVVAIFLGWVADLYSPAVAIIASQIILFILIPIQIKLFKIDKENNYESTNSKTG